MYPQKALDLLVKVKHKRQSMTQEMEKMGIGKQIADSDQLTKIRELRNLVSPVKGIR